MFPGHRGSIRLAFPRNGKSEYRQKKEEGFQEMDGKDFRASLEHMHQSVKCEGSDNRKADGVHAAHRNFVRFHFDEREHNGNVQQPRNYGVYGPQGDQPD